MNLAVWAAMPRLDSKQTRHSNILSRVMQNLEFSKKIPAILVPAKITFCQILFDGLNFLVSYISYHIRILTDLLCKYIERPIVAQNARICISKSFINFLSKINICHLKTPKQRV